jgi:hypothetical protein
MTRIFLIKNDFPDSGVEKEFPHRLKQGFDFRGIPESAL